MAPGSSRQAHARSQRDDLARVVGLELRAAHHRDRDNNGFQDHRAANPPEHGELRIALGARREELLVHRLIADHEQHGRQQEPERLLQLERAERGEMVRRQFRMQPGPAAHARQTESEANQRDARYQQPDDQVEIRHRCHASQRREGDHESRDDVHPGGLSRWAGKMRCRMSPPALNW